jgi:uncharacterized phage protein (TIGR01671 family)
MRDTMFRGKRIKTGEWIFGDLVRWVAKDKAAILPQNGDEWSNPYDFEVDPGTVGQFTGFNDDNGIPIYEGDLMRQWLEESIHINENGGDWWYCEVKFQYGAWRVCEIDFVYREDYHPELLAGFEPLDVVGNVYDKIEPI